jgi:hypothetical protein
MSLFEIFIENRFGGLDPNDSYLKTWMNRWEKGIQKVWNEGDSTTRAALIQSIEEKAKQTDYYREVPLTVTNPKLSISELFIQNRFQRDSSDSYAKNWINRFEEPIEKTMGLMDTQSLGVLVSVLKLKQKNP